jgi:protein-tyrosine phosphatase
MESNLHIGEKANQMANQIRRMSLFQLSVEEIKPILTVHRDYLEDIIDEIYMRFGSIERYLQEGCGVRERSLANLKEALVI